MELEVYNNVTKFVHSKFKTDKEVKLWLHDHSYTKDDLISELYLCY